ncbi:MAG: PPC domain-containing DNA-binding protein [Planctomycetota bacterium]
MATHVDVKHARRIMGRLGHGKDLLEELTAVATAEGVTLGRVEALGALKRARLGFYSQEEREYEFFEIDEQLELTNLVGNVSLKDGKPMVHAHVTLSDRKGAAFGGHLAPGTIVFACEFVMQVLEGPELTRSRDDATGLPLWEM